MAETGLINTTHGENLDTPAPDIAGQIAFEKEVLAIIYVVSAVLFVSILSNTFTLVLLRRSDVFSDVESILYILLAVEDMLTCSTNLAQMIALKEEKWGIFSYLMWYCVFPLIYQTLGIVLAINICRYIMIVKPLKYSRWITQRRLIFTHVGLFVISFILSYVFKLVGEEINPGKGGFSVLTSVPVLLGLIFQLVTGFHILHISVKQSRKIAAERNRFVGGQNHESNRNSPLNLDNPQEPLRSNSFKGIKTVLLIIGSYWLGWFPFVLNSFGETGFVELPVWFRVFTAFMSMLNCCWNPLIYYFTNRVFRAATNDTFRSIRNWRC